MSSDERLHALCRVRLVRDHHHPISVHVHGAQATLCVTDQAEHGFVKVLVLLYISEDARPHEINHLSHLVDVDHPLILQLLGQRGEGAEHAC